MAYSFNGSITSSRGEESSSERAQSAVTVINGLFDAVDGENNNCANPLDIVRETHPHLAARILSYGRRQDHVL